MENSFDVIVIGVGAMGSSVCYHLARRGVRVLGLEQFGIPHALGSSHGDSRMIRLCYYEHPDYVPLLLRAYELWAELEAACGQKLLHITGGLYMGDPAGGFLSGTMRAARQHGLPHEMLDRAELHRRFPQFQVPEDFRAVLEPRAGFLLPERVVAVQSELALRHGAGVRCYETVVDWTSNASGVEVRTARGTYAAKHLIICAGAWSAKLLGEIGVKLVVTRQVLGWVWPRANLESFAYGNMPVWAIDHPDGTQHYGFPIMPLDVAAAGARPGFKVAHHFHDQPTTPDAIDRTPQPNDEDDFRAAIKRFIPDADGPLLSMAVCMYTNSPDSHFIIDRHPHQENVTIACGFSGHGFKFASVMGETLADLAMHGETRHPIGFLGLKRFGH